MDDGETEAEPAGDILPPEEEEITGTWPLRSMASLTPMNRARPPLVKLYPCACCLGMRSSKGLSALGIQLAIICAPTGLDL
jgi:hypothetical protein